MRLSTLKFLFILPLSLLTLGLMAQPGNDACTTAVTLSCGDTDIAGTTTAATDDDPATCGGAGDGTAGGVWYEIAGNGDEFTITLNADPGNADDLDDSQLAVYSGTCGALVCETGNDDNTPPGGAGSQVTFTSVNGTTYYAYADGWGANSGDFLISLACVVPPMPPGNDACSAATVLNCGDTDIAGTTTAATDDDPATCGGAGDGTAGGVWYEITGNGDEFTITLNADPGNADDLDDSQLAVYSGTCGALVCETGNDDNTPPGGAGSQVTFTSVNGTTYYAYADGFGGNSGDFLISLACTSCPAPTTLTAADITGTTVNLGWTESGTATTWDIEHGAAGFTQGTGTTVTGTTTNPFALTGLTACTDYEFYVRADCGGNSSDWSGPFAFSTIGATPNLTPACGATVTYPTCPGTYNTNELVTWTLCPDAGTYAVIEFTYMDLETRTTDDLCWDQLNVTGVTTEVVCGESDGDGGIGTDFAAGDCLFHPVVDACITVEFDSDGSTNESGFSFVFTCIADPGTLSCARSQGPLPVEFTSFSGSAEDKVNVLNWETASEQNNSHFNIERSLDGINFEKIGTVNGSGNSSEVLNYSFEDDKPVSLAYYRLMQVDFDGEFEYSSTIKIKRELRGLAFGIVSPNPTKGIASIELNTASAGSFRMEMMSVDGRIVSSQTLELTEGLNTHDVDLSSFANGVYMLSISSDEDRIITRIVKSN